MTTRHGTSTCSGCWGRAHTSSPASTRTRGASTPKPPPRPSSRSAARCRVVSQLAADVARARERGVETVFYFVFAGHGGVYNEQGYVALEDARLMGADLARLVASVPAAHVHVIIDACASYFLAYSRGPGGERRRVSGFQDAPELATDPRVGLLLSTSSARDSHEWDGFQAGVFSHEVRSGLYGAADADGDGQVSYREIAAFVDRANASIPIERFRPDVQARAPRESDTLLDLRQGLNTRRLDIDGAHAAHYWVEDANGVRLHELHNAVGQDVHLLRPAPNGRAYLHRLDDDTEYPLPQGPPDVVSLAELSWAPARVASRGAAHEAFDRLFSLPFGRDSVESYVAPAPEITAGSVDQAPPRSSSSSRRAFGWSGVALGAVGLGVGAVFSFAAINEFQGGTTGQSQYEADQRSGNIRAFNTGSAVGYAVGGTALVSGLVLLLCPNAPPVHAALGPSGASLGFGGSFDSSIHGPSSVLRSNPMLHRTFTNPFAFVLASVLLAVIACGAQVSETGLPCPCSSGWTCCAPMNTCVAPGVECSQDEGGVHSLDGSISDGRSPDSNVTPDGSSTADGPTTADGDQGDAACVPDDTTDCRGKCGQLKGRCGSHLVVVQAGARREALLRWEHQLAQHPAAQNPCQPTCEGKACGDSDQCSWRLSAGACGAWPELRGGHVHVRDPGHVLRLLRGEPLARRGKSDSACGAGGEGVCVACSVGDDLRVEQLRRDAGAVEQESVLAREARCSSPFSCGPGGGPGGACAGAHRRCSGKTCGASDGCGGTCNAGTCGTGQHCVSGACTCDVTSCTGCCSGSTCEPGTDDAMCGHGGSVCSSCSGSTTCGTGSCGTCGGNGQPCCAGSACTSPLVCTGGSCAYDLVHDPHNCGSVGHDCHGGTCIAQQCQPVQVVSASLDPMMMDDTYLYGFSGVSLVKIPKTGGSPVTLVDVPTGIGGMFLDYATIYYSDSVNNGAKLSSIPKSGGTPHVYYDPGPLGQIPNLTFDGSWLYWVEYPNGSSLGSGTLLRSLATFDVNAVPTTLASSSQVAWTTLLSAGGSLYLGWNDGTATNLDWLQAGGSPTVHAAGAAPVGLTSDGQTLFWSNNGPLAIYSQPLAGGTATNLGGGASTQIAVDDRYVYGTYVNASNGYVFRTLKTGGAAQHLVDYPGNQWLGCTNCFAVDASDIYWSQSNGVYRVAK